MSLIDQIMKAWENLPIRDCTDLGGELDVMRKREAALAALMAIRYLPEQPGQAYSEGQYSRANQAAMVDDAIGQSSAPLGA